MDEMPTPEWLAKLRQKDEAAARHLWEQYFDKLTRMARNRFVLQGVFDEQDIAQSALISFVDGVHQNRFPNIDGEDAIWPLLVTITLRKAQRKSRDHKAKKRYPANGKLAGPSALGQSDASEIGNLDQAMGDDPNAETLALVLEECNTLLRRLEEPRHREIVRFLLEGYTQAEIAGKLDCSVRTVQRAMDIIREQLQRQQ